jgi:hypothetical protein
MVMSVNEAAQGSRHLKKPAGLHKNSSLSVQTLAAFVEYLGSKTVTVCAGKGIRDLI